MFDSFIQLTKNQYDASFQMLNDCIVKCDEAFWYEPMVNLSYDQAAFHALFFTDLYLELGEGDCIEKQRSQSFHLENQEYFCNYKELAGQGLASHYERAKSVEYLQFCRDKAKRVLSETTPDILEVRCAIRWLEMSQAELFVYNLKHLHHHVAQLSLKLRMNQGVGADWVKSGWSE